MDEFLVSNCTLAKEIWDVLEVTRTNEVRKVKKNSLIQEYEMFQMKVEKNFYDVQNWFTHIVNHLIVLGK